MRFVQFFGAADRQREPIGNDNRRNDGADDDRCSELRRFYRGLAAGVGNVADYRSVVAVEPRASAASGSAIVARPGSGVGGRVRGRERERVAHHYAWNAGGNVYRNRQRDLRRPESQHDTDSNCPLIAHC
jgi:hypothetical protein